MPWLVLAFGLLTLGCGWLLWTLRATASARDEHAHYRLSIRFWLALAVLAGTMVVVGLVPLLGHPWLASPAGRATALLVATLPTLVVAVGVRNALALLRAMRRRVRAMRVGVEVEGIVRHRAHPPVGHDLVRLEIDAPLPPRATAGPAYRAAGPRPGPVHRFVELCPSDHWDALAPGTTVRLRVDPTHPDTFALLLFAPRAAVES